MGGTLNRLVNKPDVELADNVRKHKIRVEVMSDATTIPGNENIIKECQESLGKVYNVTHQIRKYPTMYFRENYQKIRNDIFSFKEDFKPDLVYCTSPCALHPDHQVVGEACESIFQQCSVYGFEDVRGNQKQLVNRWAKLELDDVDQKIRAVGCYQSQMRRAYFNFDKIISMTKYRGLQIGADYAEGFEILREIV